MDNREFNHNEYNKNYRRAHKKQFNVDLNIDEYEKINELLKKNNLTKTQFLRDAILALENKK